MVVWSSPARADLRRIHNYIAKDSSHYAKKVTTEIREAAHKLVDFPQIGRVVPEIDDPSVRELFLYSYRITYRTTGKRVHVLAVIHAKRLGEEL